MTVTKDFLRRAIPIFGLVGLLGFALNLSVNKASPPLIAQVPFGCGTNPTVQLQCHPEKIGLFCDAGGVDFGNFVFPTDSDLANNCIPGPGGSINGTVGCDAYCNSQTKLCVFEFFLQGETNVKCSKNSDCVFGCRPSGETPSCSTSCSCGRGYRSDGSTCKPKCGDGIVAILSFNKNNVDAGPPAIPGIGNSAFGYAEQCDDGNTNNGDGCGASCVPEPGWLYYDEPSNFYEICGDGLVVGGEGCDDGNTKSGDGCTGSTGEADDKYNGRKTCQTEQGFSCTGAPSTCSISCGDGVLARQAGEQCDDGVANSDMSPNACRTNCRNPSCGDSVTDSLFGEQCDNGPDNGTHFCGNGVKDVGVFCTNSCQLTNPSLDEECDDGNSINSDTCTNGCLLPVCGDNIVQSGEECDTGASNSDTNANSCRTDCTNPSCGDGVQDTGEACDNGGNNSNSTPNGCRTDCSNPVCGDSVADTNFNEECDEGSSNSDSLPNACRTDCSNPFCGDAITDNGEECDTGNTVSNDGCSNTCEIEAICGDGIVGDGEECDDGPLNSSLPDACRTNCTNPVCGDGVNDTNEECDTGRSNSNTVPNRCRSNCKNPSCGDTVTDSGEECDDGNTVANDGCTNTCALPICGDGIIHDGEECDDGNNVETDSCSNTCKLPVCGNSIKEGDEECDNGPNNSDTIANRCRIDCTDATCGDGVKDIGEACDDGDTVESNSCTNSCRLPSCGDGTLQEGEECDDGNKENTDDCSNICTFATCGDDIVQRGEECDEGTSNSNVSPNACRDNCVLPRCGDRVIDGAETCDDGNTSSDDGCSSSCRLETDSSSSSSRRPAPPPPPPSSQQTTVTQITPPPSPSAPPISSQGASEPVVVAVVPPTLEPTPDPALAAGTTVISESNVSSQPVQAAAPAIDPVQQPRIVEEQKPSEPLPQQVTAVIPEAIAVDEPELKPTVASANVCGDGILSQGEQCDDGNTSSDDGCSRTCTTELILEVSNAQNPFCGDGILDSNEECDEGTTRTTPTCLSGCRRPTEVQLQEPTCGNGIFEPPEECDAGFSNSYSPGATCRPECTIPKCGDGIQDPFEDCDDNNNRDGDGCTAICTSEDMIKPTMVAGVMDQSIRIQSPTADFPIQPPTVAFPAMQQMPMGAMAQPLPYQYPFAQPAFPLAQLAPLTTRRAPVGDTGPAAVVIIGAGTAAGLSWMRRRRK